MKGDNVLQLYHRREGWVPLALDSTPTDSPERRLLFIHINKTGGVSIERALGIQGDRQHHTIQQCEQLLNPSEWERTFKFCFVRNPWDKMVSLYNFRKQKHGLDPTISFEDFCRNPVGNARTQLSWITNTAGNVSVDFIGRFERLEQDFAKLCDLIGIKNIQLGHENSTKRGPYTDYYNDQTRELVAERYQGDIEYFGYRFGA